jgi:hypothetical protein
MPPRPLRLTRLIRPTRLIWSMRPLTPLKLLGLVQPTGLTQYVVAAKLQGQQANKAAKAKEAEGQSR